VKVHDVFIIGSGFAGVAAAIRLREAGFHGVVILERAETVGRRWRDNHYPGCACDVPSRLHVLNFAPNDDWTRSYSPPPEIRAYLERAARDTGLTPHVRFNHGSSICSCGRMAQLSPLRCDRSARLSPVTPLIAHVSRPSSPPRHRFDNAYLSRLRSPTSQSVLRVNRKSPYDGASTPTVVSA
jgi:hypothetical protein